jgi:LmbE family N-acetylglucosaminyl deacetylase
VNDAAPLDPRSLPFRRMLVVAPHPDDESLGCGGLIAALTDLGAGVSTVFVTDGGASHRNSRLWPRARLAAEREREAATALDRLGAAPQPRRFLRLPDAAMPKRGEPAHEAARAALAGIAREFEPDLALLPWRRDPHRDHRDAWALAHGAFAAAGASPDVLEYAIWLDELGAAEDHPRSEEAARVRFDVSAVLARKRAAVEAHRSQTTGLVADDPDGFRLSAETIRRLVGPVEAYWRPLA